MSVPDLTVAADDAKVASGAQDQAGGSAPNVAHKVADNDPGGSDAGHPYVVWTADMAGRQLEPPSDDKTKPRPKQDPLNPKARQIMFTLNDASKKPPSADQLALVAEFERTIHALNHLYPPDHPGAEDKFRLLYRTVFGLARVALQQVNGYTPEGARKALEAVQEDIINHEAPRVKNGNIKEQLKWAAWIALPAALAYVILSRVPDDGVLGSWLGELGANRAVLANYMLLWVGCCLGVCLSYALRKPKFMLEDLVNPESDFLTPAIRLALTGTLAVLLVMFSVLEFFDLTVAKHSLSDIAKPNSQMLALVVGIVLGIGEKLLSGTVLSKSEALVGNLK